MQDLFSLVNMRPSLWETIMPVLTMFFLQAEPPEFFSPLSVSSFIKRSSYIYYTEEALREAKNDIVLLAEKEGLTAHANAIKVRFED